MSLVQVGSDRSDCQATPQLHAAACNAHVTSSRANATMADEDLRQTFLAFCSFGDRGNGGAMTGAQFSKFCRETKVRHACVRCLARVRGRV